MEVNVPSFEIYFRRCRCKEDALFKRSFLQQQKSGGLVALFSMTYPNCGISGEDGWHCAFRLSMFKIWTSIKLAHAPLFS